MYDRDIPYMIKAPCGERAYFDEGSGIGHRCGTCMAILGSIAMPQRCRAIMEMEEVVDRLRGKKNEYN